MSGQIGETRSAVTWWLISIVCGIIQLVWAYKVWEEIKNFTGKDINPVVKVILMIIPLVNIFILYTMFSEINEMEAKAGIPEGDRLSPIVNLLLMCVFGIGIIFAQNHLNDIWKRAAPA